MSDHVRTSDLSQECLIMQTVTCSEVKWLNFDFDFKRERFVGLTVWTAINL